ncbi:MAG: hypothetical protein GY717_15125 [Rhodobacteraceae bacterium]|nr:hypothetical protein [Paracoccaceae bacterium]
MSPPNGSVFVERRTYRRRRMMDAARLLPILGALLFLVPIFWTGNAEAPATTARGVIYVFAIWAGLIVVSARLSRWLTPKGGEDADWDRRE